MKSRSSINKPSAQSPEELAREAMREMTSSKSMGNVCRRSSKKERNCCKTEEKVFEDGLHEGGRRSDPTTVQSVLQRDS